MEKAHKLASSQFHLILEGRLEIELHSVDGGVSGAASSRNGSRASGTRRLVTRAGRVGAEGGSGRRSGGRRRGCRRGRQSEVEGLGAVLTGRCFATQGPNSEGTGTCSSGGTSGTSGNSGDSSPVNRVRGRTTCGSGRRRFRNAGQGLLVEGQGYDGLLGNRSVDPLGLSAKRVGGVRALACRRPVPGALARIADTESGSSRSQVGVHGGGRASAGAFVNVQVGEELGDGTEADTGSARVLASDGSGGSEAVALLVLISQALLLQLLLATVEKEEDEQEDDKDTSQDTNGNASLCGTAGPSTGRLLGGRGGARRGGRDGTGTVCGRGGVGRSDESRSSRGGAGGGAAVAVGDGLVNGLDNSRPALSRISAPCGRGFVIVVLSDLEFTSITSAVVIVGRERIQILDFVSNIVPEVGVARQVPVAVVMVSHV
ncbi:uncharacterised protein [Colletotrichum tofieldiae]|nr:uncharacterised protein [Colletotrichum tofieldiae]GKT70302.1 uncharacterised protein [Colletotrichum tofieldiae]GKT93359.1 uncharacterised protein [Colletotrichum tofieldiae]